MNKVNYSKETEKILEQIAADAGPEEGQAPRLLLHSCCAPCSSYVMEYLREYFDLTVFYYNPNITAEKEYRYRLAEEKRLIEAYNRQVEEGSFTGMHSTAKARRIKIMESPYDPDNWYQAVRGLEDCREGGKEAIRQAAAAGFDWFTTTLTISPLKNAARLNEIGQKCAEEYGVPFLPSDFKKKDGYKRSIELSSMFGLYRQNYCGCEFSRRQQDPDRE